MRGIMSEEHHSVNWATLRPDYCAGDLSVRALARQYGVSDTAIRKRAKAEGWIRTEKKNAHGSQNATSCQNANPRTKREKSISAIENQFDPICPQNGKGIPAFTVERPGRPSDYMPEVAEDICARLADGESLRSICKRPGMPNIRKVFRWLAESEDFRHQYAKATEVRADAIFEELFDIADGVKEDNPAVAKARLQIDAQKWALARMAPKKYGDRVTQEITGKDGGPLAQVNYTPEDYAKAQAALAKMLPDLD